jgi:hypothetical protein
LGISLTPLAGSDWLAATAGDSLDAGRAGRTLEIPGKLPRKRIDFYLLVALWPQ